MLPIEEMLLNRSPLDVLRESEEKYRTLFESATDGVLLLTDKIIDCNAHACAIFGLPKDELLGRSPVELSPEFQPDGRSSVAAAHELVRKALNGQLQSFSWQHFHRTKGMIDTEIALRTLDLNGRTILQATVRDVTEHNKNQAALRASEERFRLLYNSMSLGMALLEVIVDESGEPCDYRYLDLNPSYARFVNLEREKAIGKTHSMLNPGKKSAWLSEYGSVAFTGEPKRGIFAHANGRYYEIYAYSPQKGQVANLVTDVTESMVMQQQLARNNARLEMLSAFTAEYLVKPASANNYQSLANHLLALSGAQYVALNSYDEDFEQAETVAVAYQHEAMQGLSRLFDKGIVGKKWFVTADVQNVYKAGKLQLIPELVDTAPQQLNDQLCRILKRSLSTGAVYGMGLVHGGKSLGNVVFVYGHGQAIEAPEVVEIFARTVAAVLARQRAEEALRLSETKYRLLIEDSPSAIIVYDLDGVILLANRSQAIQHGYESPQELVGCSVYDLVATQDRAKLKDSLSLRVQGQVDRSIERVLLRKDGSEFIGEVTASVITDSTGKPIAIQAISQDITERRKNEDRLRYMSMHDQLTGLYNRAYFESELERLTEGGKHPVSIIVADLDGLKLVNDTFGHKRGDELLQAGSELLCLPLRKGDILARIGGDEFAYILPLTPGAAAESIVRQLRDAVEEYNNQHADLPISFSFGVATSVDYAKLLSNTYREADDLMYRDKLYRKPSARSQTVNALLAALAERDFIADGHASRMQLLSARLGDWAVLSSKQRTDLSLLVQVHDLGKVGIPDNILFKPGPLNDEEWEIMRQHPEKGYRIASASPALEGVAGLILRHHERWDGKGYPLGLKGEEIPIECRILSIVDAYDAMTNDRPYRKAKSIAEACEELIRCSGHQFDPRLVEGFLSILESAE